MKEAFFSKKFFSILSLSTILLCFGTSSSRGEDVTTTYKAAPLSNADYGLLFAVQKTQNDLAQAFGVSVETIKKRWDLLPAGFDPRKDRNLASPEIDAIFRFIGATFPSIQESMKTLEWASHVSNYYVMKLFGFPIPADLHKKAAEMINPFLSQTQNPFYANVKPGDLARSVGNMNPIAAFLTPNVAKAMQILGVDADFLGADAVKNDPKLTTESVKNSLVIFGPIFDSKGTALEKLFLGLQLKSLYANLTLKDPEGNFYTLFDLTTNDWTLNSYYSASFGRIGTPAEKHTYTFPTAWGFPVDICLEWGKDCGQAAADYFCQLKAYSIAANYQQGSDIGFTRLPKTGQTCEEDFCDGFASVQCKTF